MVWLTISYPEYSKEFSSATQLLNIALSMGRMGTTKNGLKKIKLL